MRAAAWASAESASNWASRQVGFVACRPAVPQRVHDEDERPEAPCSLIDEDPGTIPGLATSPGLRLSSGSRFVPGAYPPRLTQNCALATSAGRSFAFRAVPSGGSDRSRSDSRTALILLPERPKRRATQATAAQQRDVRVPQASTRQPHRLSPAHAAA